MLFDTHFHLDLAENPEEAVRLIEEQKIYTVAVTNLPKLFYHTEKLCEGSKYVRPALGYHPELAFQYKDQLDLFFDLIDKTRYIGEIGLDNQRKTTEDFKIQRLIFEKIINACADKENKILTIHSRKAENEVISAIGSAFPGQIILHWYSGSLNSLEMGLINGYYFSVNSAMVQSKNGKSIVSNIPLNRILLETDGPFTEYEGKKSTPSVTKYTLSEIAIIKKETIVDVTEALKSNFRALLS